MLKKVYTNTAKRRSAELMAPSRLPLAGGRIQCSVPEGERLNPGIRSVLILAVVCKTTILLVLTFSRFRLGTVSAA
jgi:hypothetical protein